MLKMFEDGKEMKEEKTKVRASKSRVGKGEKKEEIGKRMEIHNIRGKKLKREKCLPMINIALCLFLVRGLNSHYSFEEKVF